MGTVYLVGAGPGDSKLITRRGAELLRRAEVVLHDALVGQEVLALSRPEAELIDVGRRAGEMRWLTQERINRLLIGLAADHEVVVRLKGGDPLVFGRGGEEALALADANIPFEIVPGVTAGIGALAYAGIPLTHRGLATSVVFTTAHKDEGPDGEQRWRHLAGIGGTLVIYMGSARARVVTERLILLGKSPETPAALVESGTLPAQRVVGGTLANLAEQVGEPSGPSIIVVGEVARLASTLEWRACGPLSGRTVLVARARAQRSRIAASLRKLDASVLEFPAIRLRPGPDVGAFGPSLDALDQRGAVVFTGATAVRACLDTLARSGRDARSLAGLTLVAVGRETAAALGRAGLRCDVAISSYLPIRLSATLRRRLGPLERYPILLLGDGQEHSALGDALIAAGARVVRLGLAHRAVDARGRRQLERVIEAGRLDALVLPSSSAVEALFATGLSIPTEVPTFAIGPTTADTAAQRGLPSARVARGSGATALVDELREHLAGTHPGPSRRASASSDQ